MINKPAVNRKSFQIFTSTIEITISSQASNYSCCAFIETTPPQGGPVPHKHDREDEIFMALEGEFEFYADGNWSAMKAGETRVSVRGNYHSFRNVGSTPARMLLVTNGGGIDEYFERIAGLKIPDDFNRLTEISAYYGYHFLPPEKVQSGSDSK